MTRLGRTARPWLRSVALAAAGAAVVMPLMTASGSPAPYPGLPDGDGFQWSGVGQRGYGVVERARQAFWIPGNVVTADLNVKVVTTPGTPTRTATSSINKVYFVSPRGSTRPFGELRPFTVRTMAFGIIPIQATVHLSQQRTASGTPVPITLDTTETIYRTNPRTYDLADSSTEADLDVRVSDLRMDGRPIDLGTSCRTVEPAHLTLAGNGYAGYSAQQRVDALNTDEFYRTHFSAASGGRLTGNATMPAFTGCGVGEDLSELLTNAISGPTNPVLLQLTGPSCASVTGVAPGDGDAVEKCFEGAGSATLAAKQAMDELTLPSR